jgi:hypothetical protein
VVFKLLHDALIDGDFSFGRYIRRTNMNLSFGAGSQFCSLSLPGDWFWMETSTDPSALVLNLDKALVLELGKLAEQAAGDFVRESIIEIIAKTTAEFLKG